MFSLRRPFASALSHTGSSSPRAVQSLSTRLSSSMSVAAATSQEYEAVTIPPIFDIFDAPVRLAESSAHVGRRSTTTRIVAIECDGEKSQNIANDVIKARYISSLPPPIVFDGPARPTRLLRGALGNRRKMRQILPFSPQAYPPSSSFTSPSGIVCEMFDEPSRITRYKYPLPSSEVLQVIILMTDLSLTCITLSLHHGHMSAWLWQSLEPLAGWHSRTSWKTSNGRRSEHFHKLARNF